MLMISGCIINVASLLGLKGGKGSAAYAASKAGVIGLSRALAAELGEKNIRVNVIVPGYIETDMTEGMFILFQNYISSCDRFAESLHPPILRLNSVLIYKVQL